MQTCMYLPLIFTQNANHMFFQVIHKKKDNYSSFFFKKRHLKVTNFCVKEHFFLEVSEGENPIVGR